MSWVPGAAREGGGFVARWLDYDNDGWVDLVVGNYDRGYHLFRNQGLDRDSHHWLALRLEGSGPVNRDGVGAKVIVTAAGGSRQVQDVYNGSSVGSGNALELLR